MWEGFKEKTKMPQQQKKPQDSNVRKRADAHSHACPTGKTLMRGVGKKSRESCVKRGMCSLQAEKEVVRSFPRTTIDLLYAYLCGEKKKLA